MTTPSRGAIHPPNREVNKYDAAKLNLFYPVTPCSGLTQWTLTLVAPKSFLIGSAGGVVGRSNVNRFMRVVIMIDILICLRFYWNQRIFPLERSGS